MKLTVKSTFLTHPGTAEFSRALERMLIIVKYSPFTMVSPFMHGFEMRGWFCYFTAKINDGSRHHHPNPIIPKHSSTSRIIRTICIALFLAMVIISVQNNTLKCCLSNKQLVY